MLPGRECMMGGGSNKGTIAVLGAGSWGTALAILLARNGVETRLWGHDARQLAAIQADRENRRYLPGIPLPDRLELRADLGEALDAAPHILMVVPSHAFRHWVRVIAPRLREGVRLAWATKGVEPGTGKLLHQVVAEEAGEQVEVAILSGPTFAREVAMGLPTAMTVASKSADFAKVLAGYLHNETFRAYTSDDIIGVQLGGAVKNVLAVAAGIADGLGFGANTRAALITRGIAEIVRLGTALGGRRETFMGLAGLGDLVLTCTDNQSRNRRLGLELARGATLQEALAHIGQVVEGVQTAQEVMRLAQRMGVEMPIAAQVYRVLYEGCPPRAAVQALLAREQKPEFWY